jgi:hypothetical protein
MNGASTAGTQAAPPWILWITAGLAVVICSVAFVLWGVTGPRYIFDLIAVYCG